MQLLALEYEVLPDDFTRAGTASGDTKRQLKKLGIPPEAVRRVAIAMYEGEINMVIHAKGGNAYVEIHDNYISMKLKDIGPGIPDIDKAMTEGFSTASDSARTLGFGAGMGLPNMKKYTDSLEIETEIGVGTTVTMRVNL